MRAREAGEGGGGGERQWKGRIRPGAGRRWELLLEDWLGCLLHGEDLEEMDKKEKIMPIRVFPPPSLGLESKTFCVSIHLV